MLDRLTKTMFAANLNSHFHCRVGETKSREVKTIDLELIEVRERRSSPRQEQFALLFRGPLTLQLGQGMWPLHHEGLGEFDLFLVPVDRDENGMYYEAVFNRLLPTTT